MRVRDSISNYLRGQADWRSQKAFQYEDGRNLRSATALEALADYVSDGHADDLVAILAPHTWEGDNLGGEQTKRLTSRYGFDYAVTSDLQHREMLFDLWISAMQDAYEHAADHGEDWTETLYPCEVEAAVACDPLHLPDKYLEHRFKATEDEACELLASYREVRA
jgi:hypothetical protein